MKMLMLFISNVDDKKGKENQRIPSVKNNKKSLIHTSAQVRTSVKRPPVDHKIAQKRLDSPKLQVHNILQIQIFIKLLTFVCKCNEQSFLYSPVRS